MYFSVFIAGPGGHGVGVGVVQQQGAGLRHFADVFAESQKFSDGALSVHDAPGAERIAHTLVHAVFQRDVHVGFKALQAADPYAVDNVSGAPEGLPAVQRGLDFGRNPICLQIALAEQGNLFQIVSVDIGKGDINAAEFGNGHDVRKEGPGEDEAARADNGQFKTHSLILSLQNSES